MTLALIETRVVKVDLDWLYKKYRGICWICRLSCPREEASRDHIIPESLGGGYEKENQALAHKRCNTKRGNGYREIHFKYYLMDELDGLKDVKVLLDHDLIVQIGQDRSKRGFYVVVSKKQQEGPPNRLRRSRLRG